MNDPLNILTNSMHCMYSDANHFQYFLVFSNFFYYQSTHLLWY